MTDAQEKKYLQYFNDGPFIVDSFVIHKKTSVLLEFSSLFYFEAVVLFFQTEIFWYKALIS